MNFKLEKDGDEEEWRKRYSKLIFDLENDLLNKKEEIEEAWNNAFDVCPFGWLPNTWYVERLIKKKYPNFFNEKWKKLGLGGVDSLNE